MTTLETALQYTRAKISVIPIRSDGSKAPAEEWKPFQSKIADPGTLRRWFANGAGIGIIAGSVSGGLEIIDFEAGAPVPEWADMVGDHAAGLTSRLVVVRTPSGGYHCYYRSSEIAGNQKLAMRRGPDGRPKVVIETRGSGGYVIAPGSPAACHPSGKTYRLVKGDFSQIPTVTPDERNLLLDCARSFNEVVTPKAETRRPSPGIATGNRPGDDFNRSVTWGEILEPAGWKLLRRVGDIEHWRRPGKQGFGISATANYMGSDLLYVFSSNAYPFEPERSYTKFAAFALLSFEGDFSRATRELAARGYGRRTA